MGELGNQFWLRRSTHGRKPIFETPDDLWNAACEYFQWAEDNPLYEMKAFAYQGEITTKELPKMRAMTQAGLCLFLDISDDTYLNYRAKDDFLGVTKKIDATIRSQKFSGAAADLLNANIIARDLGLSDKHETEHSGNISVTELTSDQLDAKLKALLNAQEE